MYRRKRKCDQTILFIIRYEGILLYQFERTRVNCIYHMMLVLLKK